MFWTAFEFLIAKNQISFNLVILLEDSWINFATFFKEGLSYAMVIRALEEEMSWGFKLLTATTNRIYGILQVFQFYHKRSGSLQVLF